MAKRSSNCLRWRAFRQRTSGAFRSGSARAISPNCGIALVIRTSGSKSSMTISGQCPQPVTNMPNAEAFEYLRLKADPHDAVMPGERSAGSGLACLTKPIRAAPSSFPEAAAARNNALAAI